MRDVLRVSILAVVVLTLTSATLPAAEGVGQVSGVVLDGARSAIGNMTVRATDVVDPSRMFTAPSDRDGKFVISDVPAHAVAVGIPAVVKRRRRETAS